MAGNHRRRGGGGGGGRPTEWGSAGGGRPGQRVEERGTWASRARKRSEARPQTSAEQPTAFGKASPSVASQVTPAGAEPTALFEVILGQRTPTQAPCACPCGTTPEGQRRCHTTSPPPPPRTRLGGGGATVAGAPRTPGTGNRRRFAVRGRRGGGSRWVAVSDVRVGPSVGGQGSVLCH